VVDRLRRAREREVQARDARAFDGHDERAVASRDEGAIDLREDLLRTAHRVGTGGSQRKGDVQDRQRHPCRGAALLLAREASHVPEPDGVTQAGRRRTVPLRTGGNSL